MRPDRAAAAGPGWSHRRGVLVGVTIGLTAALAFGAFWIVYLSRRIPAGPEATAILAVIGAATAGSAAAVVQLLPIGQGRFLRWLFPLILVVSVTALIGMHVFFVFPRPDLSGKRVGSVLVSWDRAGCEGETVDCGGQTDYDCLKGLLWDQEMIDECWGPWRVWMVRIALILCAVLVSGGFGGSFAAATLAWRPRKGLEPHPLRLFLCYRRADSAEFADRLHDRLSERFGAGNVFRDVEAIRLGEDFRQAVRRALARCDVFLLVIGPRWLEIRDDDGARRLDRADDPVRIEIETAIARGLLIVPVLVGGAAMPRSDRMPDGFEELSNRAGAAIHGDPTAPGDPAFDASVDALVRQLEEVHELEPAAGDGAASGPPG